MEGKKEGETLTGVEVQTEKYSTGLPSNIPAWHNPLPFLYQSTGIETRFTNALDPDARSRRVFSFHKPETLLAWVQGLASVSTASSRVHEPKGVYRAPSSLLRRLRQMPPLNKTGMWPAQIRAVENLERSLADNRPRALIQMATGSGKTYTAIAEVYRLIKFADVRRVLFLVDRGNLGRQALTEFKNYTAPDDGRKFTELYNVQHLQSNTIDPVSRVCITTIQRMYSILKGDPDFDPAEEERSLAESAPTLRREPLPVVYNPAVPMETFDVLLIDECHRSIYNIWRQVLEYYDAYLIGLTATPSKQTFGFFNKNLVMEYNYAQAVADGVNVDHDVYRIRTRITEAGSTVEAGHWVDKRDKRSRKVRWQELDEDLTYAPNELDRSVVADDQIRTVVRTFRDKLFTEIFPGRTEVPKTLIFAKDDSHADDIVRIVREEFGRGNDFCEKITYRANTVRHVDPQTGGITYKSLNIKMEDRLQAFRTGYNPRIVVTVDMIATGTDVKPLEIVFFLRDVKSANYFEQMKGRGSRVMPDEAFRNVTPDGAKTRYVIVDAVGVCEREHVDAPSLERQPSVSFKRVLDVIGKGSTEEDAVSTLASRLARLDRRLTPVERESVEQIAGQPLKELVSCLVNAVDPDAVEILAAELYQTENVTPEQILQVGEAARQQAVTPFLNATLRNCLLDLMEEKDQTIDTVSQDEVLSAGYSEAARERAQAMTTSFAEFIREHRDEIDALQFFYSRPHGTPPTLKQLRQLADELQKPPRRWTPEALWHAYETLEKSKVRGGGKRVLTDLVSLVRFAMEQETILAPFAETVNDRFARWLSEQEAAGRKFTSEQRQWLEMIRDQIAGSLTAEPDDFEYVPFNEKGGLGKAHALFGAGLETLLEELNGALAS